MTPVIFRRDGADIVAVFPTMPGGMRDEMTCYQHIGQHGACSRDWYYTTRPATPAEYESLLTELRGIGYDDLAIRRRITYAMDINRRGAFHE